MAENLSQKKTEMKNDEQEQDIIRKIEKRFSGNPGLCKPGRYAIKEGSIIKKSSDVTGVDKRYQLLLFNDLVVYASSGSLSVSALHRVVRCH